MLRAHIAVEHRHVSESLITQSDLRNLLIIVIWLWKVPLNYNICYRKLKSKSTFPGLFVKDSFLLHYELYFKLQITFNINRSGQISILEKAIFQGF